jgi:hypothetical protein
MRAHASIRSPRRHACRSSGFILALLAVSTGACQKARAPTQEATASPRPSLSPPPRAIRVEEGSVVLEGRWQEVGTTASAPNTVRVVCLRGPRTCAEELATAGADADDPQRQSITYQVKDWTKWQLRAVRRDEGKDVELRISIIGLAAQKVLVDRSSRRGGEIRWRLE